MHPTVCRLNIYTVFTCSTSYGQITSVDFHFSCRRCATIALLVPTAPPASAATLYALNKDKTNTWPRGLVAMPMQIFEFTEVLLAKQKDATRFKTFCVFPTNL
jgi:hypothetical protein